MPLRGLHSGTQALGRLCWQWSSVFSKPSFDDIRDDGSEIKIISSPLGLKSPIYTTSR